MYMIFFFSFLLHYWQKSLSSLFYRDHVQCNVDFGFIVNITNFSLCIYLEKYINNFFFIVQSRVNYSLRDSSMHTSSKSIFILFYFYSNFFTRNSGKNFFLTFESVFLKKNFQSTLFQSLFEIKSIDLMSI